MKLKLNEQGQAVHQDGKPVYVYDDGKEAAIDVADMASKLTKFSGDLDTLRTRAVKAEEGLKAWEGLDPKATREQLEAVKDLDRKKLIDKGEVDKVKAELNSAWEAKVRAAEEERDTARAENRQLTVGSRFTADPHFIAVDGKPPRTFLTPDIAERQWGHLFEPAPGGKTTAKYPDGNPIYSREKPGELADFHESMSLLIEAYPRKDSILRDLGGSGAGANGGAAANGSNHQKPSTDGLGPEERLAAAYAASPGATARR